MKSWKEKLGGLAGRLKETTNKLQSVRETAENAYNKVTDIAGAVRSDISKVVGEVLNPKQTAEAVTTDGTVYTVAVDSGSAYAPGINPIGGSGESISTNQTEELKDLLPMTNPLTEFADEVRDVFSNIGGSVTEIVRPYISATRKRIAPDFRNLGNSVKSKLMERFGVDSNTSDQVNPYAPTILNMAANGSDSDSAKTATTTKRRIPAHINGATIQKEMERARKIEEKNKGNGGGDPQNPQDPKNPEKHTAKKVFIAALLAGAAGAGIWTFTSDNSNNTTAPTASAKAPYKKAPEPKDTVKETEAPAPVTTVVEANKEEEEKTVTPTTPTPRKNFAKTHKVPKTPVINPPKERKEPKVEAQPPKVATKLPADTMKYDDAVRVSGKLEEPFRTLNLAAGDTDLGRPDTVLTTFDIYGGSSHLFEVPTRNWLTRGTIQLYTETAMNLKHTYDSNLGCLRGGKTGDKVGGHTLQCDSDHVWTLDNMEKMEGALSAAAKMEQIAQERKAQATIDIERTLFQNLEQAIEASIQRVRDAKLQDNLRSRLATLKGSAALVRTGELPSDPVERKQELERRRNRWRGLVAHAQLLGNDAETKVVESHFYRIKPHNNGGRIESQMATAQPKEESAEDLRNWIPESI